MIPGSTAHIGIVKAIREDHIASAQELIRDREILGRVEREIDFECNRLEDFLNAGQVSFVPADSALIVVDYRRNKSKDYGYHCRCRGKTQLSYHGRPSSRSGNSLSHVNLISRELMPDMLTWTPSSHIN